MKEAMYMKAVAGLSLLLFTIVLFAPGCAEKSKEAVVPAGPPTADFTAAPTSGGPPLVVQFTDASTGNITAWKWDFESDGTVDSTVRNPTEVFTECRRYTVSLKATGPEGWDIEVKPDYIIVGSPPLAGFAATPTSGEAPLAVQFTDASAGSVTSWAWDFECDGVIDSTARNPTHTYTEPGTYTVTCRVSGPDGWDDETKRNHIALGDTVYVDGTNGDDANNGLSWGTALRTIQAGLDLAGGSGWTVLVADGTYRGAGNKELNFAGKALHLKSRGGPVDCTIDCENAGGGFFFDDGEGPDSIVEGFTIRDSYLSHDRGGAVCCVWFSSPTITNCFILNNYADSGGGIACVESSPTITDCTITNNSAGAGGGIDCYSNSSPTITNCRLSDNSADGGGAVSCESSCPTITGCTIASNSGELGGGIYCVDSTPAIINSTIVNNSASAGGAIFCSESSPEITNCTIAENAAYHNGGAISCLQSTAAINNTVIWGNTATSGNQIYTNDAACALTLGCCDYADGAGEVEGGGTVTPGNCINSDPLFVNAAGADYRLQDTSPCIDRGENGLVFWDYDLGRNIRLTDGDNNGTATVDIGAYEYQGIGNRVPTVLIEGVPARTIGSPTATFTYTGADTDGAVVGYQVSIDTVPPDTFTTDTTWTCPSLSVGVHTFYVQALDDDSARSVPKSYVFSCDPTPQTRSVPGEYANIAQAMGFAQDSDTVLVADGTYTGEGNKNLDFRGKAIHVKSAGGATNCTIDCEGQGGAFYFHSAEDAGSIVEGFTIRGGYLAAGAAILCENASPTITACIITANSTDWGSGGIFCSLASPIISNCRLSNNSGELGGGICCYYFSSPVITNCTLTDNSAELGGGVYSCFSSNPTLTNCTIARNQVNFGGGLYCYEASAVLGNSILWGNSAAAGGNQIYIYDPASTLTLNHCDWSTTGSDVVSAGSITASDCFTTDPLFVNAAAGDYRLQAASPCVDAGDNSLLPVGVTTDLDGNPRVVNTTIDLGAYEKQ